MIPWRKSAAPQRIMILSAHQIRFTGVDTREPDAQTGSEYSASL